MFKALIPNHKTDCPILDASIAASVGFADIASSVSVSRDLQQHLAQLVEQDLARASRAARIPVPDLCSAFAWNYPEKAQDQMKDKNQMWKRVVASSSMRLRSANVRLIATSAPCNDIGNSGKINYITSKIRPKS